MSRPSGEGLGNEGKTIVGSFDYTQGAEQWKADMTGQVVCPLFVKNLPGKLGAYFPKCDPALGRMPRLDFGRVAALDNVEFNDYPLDYFDSVSRGRGSARLLALASTSEKHLENCDMTVWLDEQEQFGKVQLALSRTKLVIEGYAGFTSMELNGNNSAVVVKSFLRVVSIFGVDVVYDPDEADTSPQYATQLAVRESRLIVKGDVPFVLASCDEYSAKWLQGTFYTTYGLPDSVVAILEANPKVRFVNALPEKLAAVYYPARGV